MKKINLSQTIIALFVATAFISCNSSETKNGETKQADATVAATSTPFNSLVVKHPVADYSKWLPAFNGHDTARKAAGLTDIGIGRGMDDSNMVVIMMKADDVQKAKDFASSPGLKDAMQRAGVTGAPEVSFIHVIRNDASKISQTNRLMVAHHVKDFNAWLKVYDGEGIAKRTEQGFTDRALGRGIDDSNMVYIIFAVNDLAKTKAAITSDEKKKLMTDAGVDSPPQMFFYDLTMLKE